MSPRAILSLAAAALLLGAFAVTTYDRLVTAAMVRCLKSTFGKEGAPVRDLPECRAAWDAQFGHRSTRAFIADAAGPYGAFQAATAMAWSCAPALTLLLAALFAEGRRGLAAKALGAAPIAIGLVYVTGCFAAMLSTERGGAEGWLSAQRQWEAISWLPVAAAAFALTTAVRERPGRQAGA